MFALGGGVAAAGLAEALSSGGSRRDPAPMSTASRAGMQQRGLPAVEMQKILEAEGLVSGGVLTIGVTRDDLGTIEGSNGMAFTGSFGLAGTLTFEPLGHGRAHFGGELAITAPEVDPVVDAITANQLTVEAVHQPFVAMHPQILSVYWRGMGDPLGLARSVRKVLRATGTALPQTQPQGPQSPLDAERLAEVLHGAAQIGRGGVVTVTVGRRDRIDVGHVRSAAWSASSRIAFKPEAPHAGVTDVASNLSLTGSEVQRVVADMRQSRWHMSCLAHHDTEESPQLYFAQMLKTGNALALASEVRRALDLTGSAD